MHIFLFRNVYVFSQNEDLLLILLINSIKHCLKIFPNFQDISNQQFLSEPNLTFPTPNFFTVGTSLDFLFYMEWEKCSVNENSALQAFIVGTPEKSLVLGGKI